MRFLRYVVIQMMTRFLRLRFAGAADFIATEDKDLLDMIEYKGVRIVTGLELLSILRS